MQLKSIKTSLIHFIKNPATRRLILVGLFVGITSFLLTFYIQYRYLDCDLTKTQQFITENTRVFWFSSLIIFAIQLFLIGITGNCLITFAALLSLIILVTFINSYKMLYRNAPFLPEDFIFASNPEMLASFQINPIDIVKTILVIILVILLFALLNKYLKKKFPARFKLSTQLLARFVFITTSLIFLIYGTEFINSTVSKTYEKNNFLRTEFVAWDQLENYNRNGFVIATIYNLRLNKMRKPANYSASTIANIMSKYQIEADESNKTRLDLSKDDINIIFVMNESFTIPNDLAEIYPYTGGDATPNINQIMQGSASGRISSSEYGGGTANIEFEALTGFSNFFLNTVPYTNVMSKLNNAPSIVSYLKKSGYEATALHPFNRHTYKRDIVYNNLGFDNYYSHDNFKYLTSDGNSQYANDASAYKQLLYQLDSTEQKQFITLVTMQNHMPYGWTYPNHAFSTAADVDKDTANSINDYLESIHSSDAALGNLISELKKTDKKVVLVFWGDHLPGIYKKLSDSNPLKYQTPFFIYSNFNEKQQDLGIVSANQISNQLLNYLHAKKPAFYYLLDSIYTTNPVLTKALYEETNPETVSPAIEDYEYLTYDALYGNRYTGF